MTQLRTDIEHLINRKLSGEISADETQELFRWIAEKDDNALLYQKAMNNLGRQQKQLRKSAIWNKIQKKSVRHQQSNNNIFSLSRMIKVAAILALIALIPLALGKYGEDEQGYGFTHKVVGSELVSSFYLPDGTKVFLSRGSELSYNDGYNQSNRELVLKGKAYIEIDPTAAHLPVIVNSGKRCAIARNGKLVIDSESNHLDVAVEEGEVTVVDTVYKKVIIPMFKLQPAKKIGSKEVALFESTKVKQGQRVTYSNKDEMAKTSVGNYCDVFSWKDKIFCFNNLKQHELAFKIAEWYDKRVEFKGELNPYQNYSGSYNDPSVQDLLNTIFDSEVLEVKITKRKITVVFS
ncbi:FecR family protein [Carboxylicivirga sp. M1479]|uniref:FecR family protein n=1 Tax=Carboxylicivirga sp. M1479 TaxID=2594476 RepID=UPI0011785C91|nr:FecR family protein [Carboxylicivirga sp. M1479]TRX71844.1 FecR family protein [Carboxylicivirga sp. M1479]